MSARWRGILPARNVVLPFAGWELLIMRLALAGLVWFFVLAKPPPFATMPLPVGIGRVFDLTFLSHPAAWSIAHTLAGVALISYVLGSWPLSSTLVVGAVLLGDGTLRNSQGATGHSTQLVTLVVLMQAATAAWDDIFRQTARHPSARDRLDRQRRMAHAARVMIAAAYLTSAITKLDSSGGHWLFDTPNLSVQIVKSFANVYYDTLKPVSPFNAETVPNWIAAHPWPARVFFAPALFIECFLFLGLAGRGWSLLVGLAAVTMHVLITYVMRLSFPLHEALLWIFYINPPYWIHRIAGRIGEPRHSP